MHALRGPGVSCRACNSRFFHMQPEYSVPVGVLFCDQHTHGHVSSAVTCLSVQSCVTQDAVHAKGRASAALQQAQQQLDQSKEHLTLLKKQLAEERQSDAAVSANLDCVQAELAQCKTQVNPGFAHNVACASSFSASRRV